MLLLRRTVAVLLIFIAMLACVMALGNQRLTNHSIENARLLDEQFMAAARAVERFELSNGRLPTTQERIAALPEPGSGKYDILLAEPGFKNCVAEPDRFKNLKDNEYIFVAWQGEWFECYAPTKKWSTLALDPAEYTILGSVWLDTLGYVMLAAAFIGFAGKLFKRPHAIDKGSRA